MRYRKITLHNLYSKLPSDWLTVVWWSDKRTALANLSEFRNPYDFSKFWDPLSLKKNSYLILCPSGVSVFVLNALSSHSDSFWRECLAKCILPIEKDFCDTHGFLNTHIHTYLSFKFQLGENFTGLKASVPVAIC